MSRISGCAHLVFFTFKWQQHTTFSLSRGYQALTKPKKSALKLILKHRPALRIFQIMLVFTRIKERPKNPTSNWMLNKNHCLIERMVPSIFLSTVHVLHEEVAHAPNNVNGGPYLSWQGDNFNKVDKNVFSCQCWPFPRNFCFMHFELQNLTGRNLLFIVLKNWQATQV